MLTRREMLHKTGLGVGLYTLSHTFNISYASSRPALTHGIQTGDVSANQAIVWARADRAARLHVRLSARPDFQQTETRIGGYALPESDFTSKLQLQNLLPDQQYYYQVQFASLDGGQLSEPVTGQFKTAPVNKTDIRFVWSGDVAGQGWGIDVARGGMRTWQTMLDCQPDFFIHSGDCIYADGAITSEVKLKDGSLWKNQLSEAVSKVAETLSEFRGRYQYNLSDKNVLAFNQQVPIFAQWDDHETTNNWYPGEILDDDRYREKNINLLSARANQAFLEYLPIAPQTNNAHIYRKLPYGAHLDIFMLDMRSYRGPNTTNVQSSASAETSFLGMEQLAWLKTQLKQSKTTWKVIAADMPIGLLVKDGDTRYENGANGDPGKPLGRELEIAELLRFIKQEQIHNVVWLTADVHYTAAHYYDPNQAAISDFLPFWEFVTGPIHAGTFGPNELDKTFGPQVMFQKAPSAEMGVNLPPSDGYQFFGQVEIAKDSGDLTVTLYDANRQNLYQKTLQPS